MKTLEAHVEDELEVVEIPEDKFLRLLQVLGLSDEEIAQVQAERGMLQ